MGLGAQIAARRQKNRRLIEVAEWGDEKPLEIFASVLTCHDVDRLQKKHKDFLNGNMTIEAMVDLIILKAETRDGEKMFTLEDKSHLMREPVLLVTRIAGEVFGSVLSVEDAQKLASDPLRMNLFALADRLGKTVEEISEISLDEFHEWIAYFRVKDGKRHDNPN